MSLLERLAARPDEFPGAILLHGGSDRTLDETSLALAALLLCRGADPDRRCDSCRRALHGFHPDFLALSPEGVQIRVDRIREAILFGAGRPYESERRVVRISRAEFLGPEAANALLKTLEEPGSRLHWILTTRRPEALLPTIRSRCLPLPVPSPSFDARTRSWHESGAPAEDAADLVVFGIEGPGGWAESLEEARRFRAETVAALHAGIVEGKVAAFVLLAETLGRAGASELRVMGELLADAALLAAGVSPELVRHRAVTRALSEIGRSCGSAALVRAATEAADYPPDSRRGNRRLHFEALLLRVSLARPA